jgi:hypothetical protein
MANDITDTIQAAKIKRGTEILTHQLEATDDDGVPFLPRPIPDNPLMPGIASINEQCPPDAVTTQSDWVYCPTSGIIRAVMGGQSTSGNE